MNTVIFMIKSTDENEKELFPGMLTSFTNTDEDK